MAHFVNIEQYTSIQAGSFSTVYNTALVIPHSQYYSSGLPLFLNFPDPTPTLDPLLGTAYSSNILALFISNFLFSPINHKIQTQKFSAQITLIPSPSTTAYIGYCNPYNFSTFDPDQWIRELNIKTASVIEDVFANGTNNAVYTKIYYDNTEQKIAIQPFFHYDKTVSQPLLNPPVKIPYNDSDRPVIFVATLFSFKTYLSQPLLVASCVIRYNTIEGIQNDQPSQEIQAYFYIPQQKTAGNYNKIRDFRTEPSVPFVAGQHFNLYSFYFGEY